MSQDSYGTKKISPEAEFNTEDIIEIRRDTISSLKGKAAVSPRGRYRICLHHSADHPVNEMVIIGNRSTYVRPHRHPHGRDESYYLIEGKMVVFIFDETGHVTRMIKMGEYGSNLTVLYRLCSSLWHLPVALTEQVVYHEVLTGPFKKEETVEYAPWSPDETEKDSVVEYMKELLKIYEISQK